MPSSSSFLRFVSTVLVVCVAIAAALVMWRNSMYSPWTRDARVRANVVRLAADVSGPISEVRVHDNQAIHRGDVILVIDQERYHLALADAQANLLSVESAAEQAGAEVNAASAGEAQRQAEFDMLDQRAKRRAALGSVVSREDRDDASATASSAQATLRQARASSGQASASRRKALADVEKAKVAVAKAQLDLDRTELRSPVDGYVTNLDARVGDYARAGDAKIAIVDRHSYYIYGYFEETKLSSIAVGDPVDILLMGRSGSLQGRVSGIARGITDADNPTGNDLLAQVAPTFSWVRLARRIPVRVELDTPTSAPDIELSAGMSATLRIHSRTPTGGA
jgi:multidrug resistance efflux pump